MDERFVESDLGPLIGFVAGETIQMVVGDEPECYVGSFGGVCEAVGGGERIGDFSG
jgi:hypothetical protein